jgi:hypothetical protein
MGPDSPALAVPETLFAPVCAPRAPRSVARTKDDRNPRCLRSALKIAKGTLASSSHVCAQVPSPASYKVTKMS